MQKRLSKYIDTEEHRAFLCSKLTAPEVRITTSALRDVFRAAR